MEYRILGKTGLSVSRLGFGGIPIQRTDAESVHRLFDSLISHGVNFIDTARAYTVSEEYIGGAIAGRRDKFVLATKSMAKTRELMATDIDKSLKVLGTDYIDLYQLHNPSLDSLDSVFGEGGALEALLSAKKAGKIGHIGITAHSADVFRRALTMEEIETVMFPYNVVEVGETELIDECARSGRGFICMKPLAGGAIRDAHTALRFIAANDSVTVMIPGVSDEKELEENLRAITDDSPLTPSELASISEIRMELGDAFCRRCGYCMPCTAGINIPSVFLFDGYLTRYGLEGWARDRYATLSAKASACVGCGICEARCPYGLPIRRMMREASQRLDI